MRTTKIVDVTKTANPKRIKGSPKRARVLAVSRPMLMTTRPVILKDQ